MKKLKIYLVSLILLMTFSCEDDFLETQPFSFVTLDSFYQTPDEAEIALTGVYNILTASRVEGNFGNNSTFSRNLLFVLNGATDEALARDNDFQPDHEVWGRASFTSQSNFVNEWWVYFYSGIARANYLLERIEPLEEFEGNRKNEIIAEARLLRGFYHMMLSMMHGGIPVYESTDDDQKKPRNTIEEVYNSVLADYEFAYETLGDRAVKLSRVNKWTAAGLLAKAHTYLASAKLYGLQGFIDVNSFDWVNPNQHYASALNYTQDVVDNSGYQLTENYDYLFRETTKQQQYEETLFTAEASPSSTQNVINSISQGFIPQGNTNLYGGGFGWYRPTFELYQIYNDGDFRKEHNLTGNINSGDRFEFIEGIKYFVPRDLPGPDKRFYCIGKYRMIDPALKTLPTFASSINIPILRYADVILLHAEALYHTGNESGARNMLSQVRARSIQDDATLDQLNTAYFRNNFLDELIEERSRELCFENWRRIDLARFNRYDQAIDEMSTEEGFYNISTAQDIKDNWRPERVWLPIATIQMDLNENLVQNQGY